MCGRKNAIRPPRQQPFKVRLWHGQRQRAEIVTIEGQDIEGVKLQKSARSRPSCGPSCCGGGLSRPVHLRHSQQCLLYELHFNGVPAMPRTLISSGSYLEPEIGFSRAVRVGQFIAVAGTAPIAAAGGTAALGDASGQTIRCLEIIREAVAEAGGTMANIIRTRNQLAHMARSFEIFARHARSSRFPASSIPPGSSRSKLIAWSNRRRVLLGLRVIFTAERNLVGLRSEADRAFQGPRSIAHGHVSPSRLPPAA